MTHLLSSGQLTGSAVALAAGTLAAVVNNRSAPRQNHSHRWKSPSFLRIRPRNDSKVLMVLECIVLEDGLGGCCFRGSPGGYFWAIFGAPEPND